jgi:hypothetical protein
VEKKEKEISLFVWPKSTKSHEVAAEKVVAYQAKAQQH